MRTIGNLTISGSLNTSGSIRATTFIGVVSSSAQLSTEISGAFTSTSASLASDIQNNDTRLSTLEGKTLVSSSAQISYTGITDIPANIISSSAQLSNSTIPGNLTVGGILTAQEFHTEFVSASIIYQSGSTQFGNTVDDIHNFSGSLAVNTNNLFVSGGNVGIGTTSPVAKFEVADGFSSITLQEYNNGAAIFLDGVNGDFSGGDYYHILADGNSYLGLGGYAGGTTPLNINSSGNVGIGTTNPLNKLTVVNNNTKSTIAIGNTSPSTYSQLLMYGGQGKYNWSIGTQYNVDNALEITPSTSTEGTTFSTPAFVVTSGSKIGIGTNSPNYKLSLRDDNTSAYPLSLENINIGTPGTHTGIRFGYAGNTYQKGAIIFEGQDGTGRGKMYFAMEGTQTADNADETDAKMTIDYSGNVGIGTTSPASKLNVVGDGAFGTSASSTANGVYLGGTSQYYGAALIGSSGIYAPTGKLSIQIPTHGVGTDYGLTEQMVIEVPAPDTKAGRIIMLPHGGNVGIGTSSPQSFANLQVKTATDRNAAFFDNASGVTLGAITDAGSSATLRLAGYPLVFTGNGGSGAEHMRIDSSGNLGLGVTPSAWSAGTRALQVGTYGALTWFGGVDIGMTNNAYYDGTNWVYIQSQEAARYLNNRNTFAWYIAPAGTAGNPITFTQAMTLDANGRLGIGTSSPVARLHAASDAAGAYGGIIYNTSATGEGLTVRGGSTSSQNALVVQTYDGNQSLLTVRSDGNVGIGTTSPDRELHIKSNSGAQIKLESTSTGNWNGIDLSAGNGAYSGYFGILDNDGRFFIDNGTNGDDFTILQNGNVGIGTTSPSAKLEILSDGSAVNGAEIRLQHANNNSTDVVSTVNFANNVGSVAMIQGGTTGANNNGYISFFTDNAGTSSEKMRIDASGNVGIGTTSPISSLHNVGALVNQGTFNLYNSQGPYSTLRIEPAPTIGSSTNKITTINTTDLAFELGLSERMRITTTGNVGIGTTTPNGKLDVALANGQLSYFGGPNVGYSNGNYAGIGLGYFYRGSSSPAYAKSAIVQLQTGDGSARGTILFLNNNDANTNNASITDARLAIQPGGNVGIGTTSPSYKLHVNGSVAGVGSYVNLSDESYKKNVYDISYGINEIKQLRPISFNWINEDYGTRTNLGFIAQDVELVMPEIVLTADDDVKSIASTDLIPVLTKAIQEQQTIIEAQETKIQELETLIQSLASRIEVLENN